MRSCQPWMLGIACAVATVAGGAWYWLRGRSDSPWWQGMRKPDFAGWPSRQRVEAAAGVGLVRRDGWGFAIQAQNDIPANTSVLALPASAVFTVEVVHQRNPRSAAQLADPASAERLRAVLPGGRDEGDSEWATAQLAVGLLAERHRGEDGLWYDWLRTLPAAFRGDLYWGAESSCLPEWPRNAQRRRARTAAALVRLVRLLRAGGAAAELPEADEAAARWALSAVGSRAWWRPAPQHLALLPVIDVADTRARPEGQPSWRPRAPNCRVRFDESGAVHLVTARPLRRGEFAAVGLGPHRQVPSELTAMHGVIDPDWSHVFSHLDLSEVDPERCRKQDLLLLRNGSATPALEHCIARYRKAEGSSIAERSRAVGKMLAFHAEHMLQHWRFPAGGPCSRSAIAGTPHGAEVSHLIDAHRDAFGNARRVYQAQE
eukprot:TRINITY_DN60942_c0_g1_i1.p1 TRINITY_DN60942_c0_g1~~TRINITY_DN60942_c0_g1_i1.p1  ORF type:complete len:483 (+),score=102.11 TRINITY_DN60942_c0_g1_i1:159-1451(+)